MRVLFVPLVLLLLVGCEKETMRENHERFYKECLDMELNAVRLKYGESSLNTDVINNWKDYCSDKAKERAYSEFE